MTRALRWWWRTASRWMDELIEDRRRYVEERYVEHGDGTGGDG